LRFHDNSGYANAPQCYVIRTFRILLVRDVICRIAFFNFANCRLILFQFSTVLTRSCRNQGGWLALPHTADIRVRCQATPCVTCDGSSGTERLGGGGGFSSYLDFPHTASFRHCCVHIFHSFSTDSV